MKKWAAIARYGGIGDNLMAGSPLRVLKKMGYMTEVITGSPNHVLFHHNPYIDKLSVHDTDRDLPKNDVEGWQRWHESRSREYDIFIHASHGCEGRHAVFKHMTSFWWPPEQRRKICSGSYLETMHDLGPVPYDFGPLFFASPEEHANAMVVKKQIGERFLLWVLSGTRIDKVYPRATYVIPRIIKELDIPVLVMGGPHEMERAMAQTIRDAVEVTNGDREKLFIADPYPIRISLALALCADLVVTPDTGTAWAVAMEPMPKIVLISHASAENITKHWVNTITLHADPSRVPCWPCHRLHDDKSTCVENREKTGAACISDISVEKLVQTVGEAWRSNHNIVHAEQVFKVAHRKEHEGRAVSGRRQLT